MPRWRIIDPRPTQHLRPGRGLRLLPSQVLDAGYWMLVCGELWMRDRESAENLYRDDLIMVIIIYTTI